MSNSFQRKRELITTPFLFITTFVIEAVFISNKLQSAEVEHHFGKFHNHTGYQACKAIVIGPAPQEFICLVKQRNGTF